jgi:hypothetical protein
LPTSILKVDLKVKTYYSLNTDKKKISNFSRAASSHDEARDAFCSRASGRTPSLSSDILFGDFSLESFFSLCIL